MNPADVEQLYFKRCERCERCERHRLSVVAVTVDDETQFLCALCRSDDEGWKKLVTPKEDARGQNIVDIATARAERLLGAQVAGEAISVEDPEICS